MIPPKTYDVLDSHGGFTAITTKDGQTLWRPGRMLTKTTLGDLVSYDEKSFYQTNNNVTKAVYNVKGYNYPVAVWFDNETGLNVCGKEFRAISNGMGSRRGE